MKKKRDNTVSTQIGSAIKELRQHRKMKLIELAEISKVQLATLSRIEHGIMTGTVETHIDIAKALGVRLTEIYKYIDEIKNSQD
jgi:transcriptional regulator with XRE-family HTH domain